MKLRDEMGVALYQAKCGERNRVVMAVEKAGETTSQTS